MTSACVLINSGALAAVNDFTYEENWNLCLLQWLKTTQEKHLFKFCCFFYSYVLEAVSLTSVVD